MDKVRKPNNSKYTWRVYINTEVHIYYSRKCKRYTRESIKTLNGKSYMSQYLADLLERYIQPQ
jgi:hypothetical protein